MSKKNKKKIKKKRISNFPEIDHDIKLIESRTKVQSHDANVADSIIRENSEECLNSYDIGLLDRSKMHWQFGEWLTLIQIDISVIEVHPDKAKLALMVASAHQQLNNHFEARHFISLAEEWGCDKKLMARVLISGVHNTLGRASLLAKQDARAQKHFQCSIDGISGNRRLASLARMTREVSQLGFTSIGDENILSSNISLGKHIPFDKFRFNAEFLGKSYVGKKEQNHSVYDQKIYEFYRNVSIELENKTNTPFILLDVKSLPRSGLHYMQRTFSRVLGDTFSFCERYQEPGCCKKMPCALKSYAERCRKNQAARLRLTKSHDFSLLDPSYSPVFSARHIILIRDTLSILTSYFALEMLMRYKTELRNNGISMNKIWFFHEPEVIASAYEVMDRYFHQPAIEDVEKWLANKGEYIVGFYEKWVRGNKNTTQKYFQIIRYNEINSFIGKTLAEIEEYMPSNVKEKIGSFNDKPDSEFYMRSNPYDFLSTRLSAFIIDNCLLFDRTASRIDAVINQGE